MYGMNGMTERTNYRNVNHKMHSLIQVAQYTTAKVGQLLFTATMQEQEFQMDDVNI
jgi:hypothetical protein